jgi:uncharacterized membrane protein
LSAGKALLIGVIALSLAFAKLEPDVSVSRSSVYAGESVDVNASVYNAGDQAERDVTLSVSLPTGSRTFTLPRLAAGATWTPPSISLYLPEGTEPGAYGIGVSTRDFSANRSLTILQFPLSLDYALESGKLSYSVKNTGKSRMGNLTVAVRLPREFTGRGSELLSIGALGAGEQLSHDFYFDMPEGASGTYSLRIEVEFHDSLGRHYLQKFASLSTGGLNSLQIGLTVAILAVAALLVFRTKLKK